MRTPELGERTDDTYLFNYKKRLSDALSGSIEVVQLSTGVRNEALCGSFCAVGQCKDFDWWKRVTDTGLALLFFNHLMPMRWPGGNDLPMIE